LTSNNFELLSNRLKVKYPERVLEGRSKSSKSVLFISDMHVGSYNAVCSPNPEIKDTEIKPTPLQKRLYETWCWVRDKVKKPYILCVNGEPIDGDNKRQVGADLWTTDYNFQIKDAVKLLKMYNPTHFLMTRGSGYHTTKDATNYEEICAEELGCTKYRTGYTIEKIKGWNDNKHISTRTDHHLTLDVLGKVFSVTHHVGYTRWFSYQPTALIREMANSMFLKGKYWKGDDFPTFFVRSHTHYYCQVRFSTTTGFVTPAWKFGSSYEFKGGVSGTAPSIGGIEVIIEPNGQYDVNPYILEDEKYPKMEILRL